MGHPPPPPTPPPQARTGVSLSFYMRTTAKNRFIRTNRSSNFYSGKFTLVTQWIKPNSCLIDFQLLRDYDAMYDDKDQQVNCLSRGTLTAITL